MKRLKNFNIDDSENIWEQVIRNAKGELFFLGCFLVCCNVFLNRWNHYVSKNINDKKYWT
jgi:hypothetical protein